MTKLFMGSAMVQKDNWVGVVDDDASIRSSLARVLRGTGIPVETFGSAEEFMERASESVPCCIILDLHLGGLSGLDLLDLLQFRPAAMPGIICVTGHDELSFAQIEVRPGVAGCLRKPFEVSALLSLVRPHLAGG